MSNLSDDEFARCRKAFVKLIKDENFESDDNQSVRQNWAGPKWGFADQRIQARWLDFHKGWELAVT